MLMHIYIQSLKKVLKSQEVLCTQRCFPEVLSKVARVNSELFLQFLSEQYFASFSLLQKFFFTYFQKDQVLLMERFHQVYLNIYLIFRVTHGQMLRNNRFNFNFNIIRYHGTNEFATMYYKYVVLCFFYINGTGCNYIYISSFVKFEIVKMSSFELYVRFYVSQLSGVVNDLYGSSYFLFSVILQTLQNLPLPSQIFISCFCKPRDEQQCFLLHYVAALSS